MTKKIVYQSFGGGIIGVVKLGITGMTFSVSEDQLNFSMSGVIFGRDDYVLLKEEVRQVTTFTGFFCWGIRLDHSNLEVPNNIQFWVFSKKERERLVAVLKSLSYSVVNGFV